MQDTLRQLPGAKDTVVVYNVPPEILEFYQNTLESTNSQLSLWFNPYAIMVGTLGILFTGATVVAAIILYRQSKEFQNRYNELFEESRKKINELASRLSLASDTVLNNLKEEESKLSERIKLVKAEMKSMGNSEKSKQTEEKFERLEKELEGLKNKTENFKKDYEIQNPVPYYRAFNNIKIVEHSCSKCGTKFKYKIDTSQPRVITLTSGLKCPSCGQIDEIPYHHSFY